MIYLHLFAIFLPVIAFPRNVRIQNTTNCSQLGRYAFHPELRNRMATGIMFHQGKKDTHPSTEYLCALEGMAGLILENPRKPVNCTIDLGIFPLIFESDGKVDDAYYVSRVALEALKPHLTSLSVSTGFGCNSVLEDRKHKYLCLFKLDTEIFP